MKDYMFNIPLSSIMDDIFFDLTSGTKSDPSYPSLWRSNITGIIKNKYPARPPMDHILSKDKTNIFEIAAAGFDRDDINVEREGNTLYVTAKRERENRDEDDIVLHHTLSQSDFTIAIKASEDLDLDKVDIELSRGILKIKIPPKPEALPERKKITIR